MDNNNPLKDLKVPNLETTPFIRDVGSRFIKGAGVGFLIGLLFFKKKSMRRICLYYGAGFGIGMSYL
jgi:hypothetical protein